MPRQEAHLPNQTGGRALLGALVPQIDGEAQRVIVQLTAFAVVTGGAVAPRTAIPLLKVLVLLYGLGIGPS